MAVLSKHSHTPTCPRHGQPLSDSRGILGKPSHLYEAVPQELSPHFAIPPDTVSSDLSSDTLWETWGHASDEHAREAEQAVFSVCPYAAAVQVCVSSPLYSPGSVML